MTRQAKSTGASKGGDQQLDYEALIEANGANVEAFTKATEAMVKGFAELNQEMMTFSQRRFEENMNRSMALMHCKNVEEAFQVQCDFIKSATQQYLEESNQLMTMMAKLTKESWSPVEDRTKQALHEVTPE